MSSTASEARRQPKLASAPFAVEGMSLDGRWLQNNGEFVLIKRQQVHWPYQLDKDAINILDDALVELHLDGETHMAELSVDQMTLSWSDGDMWSRVHACYLPVIEEEDVDVSAEKSDCGDSTCSTIDTLDECEEQNDSCFSSLSCDDNSCSCLSPLESSEMLDDADGSRVQTWIPAGSSADFDEWYSQTIGAFDESTESDDELCEWYAERRTADVSTASFIYKPSESTSACNKWYSPYSTIGIASTSEFASASRELCVSNDEFYELSDSDFELFELAESDDEW